MKQFTLFMTETAQFLTVYSLDCQQWGTFLNLYSFISGVKDLNMKYMYMKNRKKLTVHVFMTKTDQFLTVYSLYVLL